MSNTQNSELKTNENLTLSHTSLLLAGFPPNDGLLGSMVCLTALYKQSSIILLHQLFLNLHFKLKKSSAVRVDDRPRIFSMKKSYFNDIKCSSPAREGLVRLLSSEHLFKLESLVWVRISMTIILYRARTLRSAPVICLSVTSNKWNSELGPLSERAYAFQSLTLDSIWRLIISSFLQNQIHRWHSTLSIL